jgi:hypothetical protein
MFKKRSSANRAFYDKVYKNMVESDIATDNSMAHAHFMARYLRLQTHTQNT